MRNFCPGAPIQQAAKGKRTRKELRMKNLLLAAVLAISLSAFSSGCSGGGSSAEGENPNPSQGAGKLVNRTDLLIALWTDGSDKSSDSDLSDANCLASSTFIVRNAVGFDIMSNMSVSEMNITPSVIVSPINIEISDSAGVSRGDGCASGDVFYVVSASEDTPMDIEAAEKAAAEAPADAATANAKPYAEGCDVIAHFEKASQAQCIEGEEPAEEVAEEGGEAELDSDEEVAEGETEGEGSEEDETATCDSESEIQTMRLVVDSLICEAATVQ